MIESCKILIDYLVTITHFEISEAIIGLLLVLLETHINLCPNDEIEKHLKNKLVDDETVNSNKNFLLIFSKLITQLFNNEFISEHTIDHILSKFDIWQKNSYFISPLIYDIILEPSNEHDHLIQKIKSFLEYSEFLT